MTFDSDSTAPPDGRAWDLLVIGGGTAGIVAARTAAGFGARVLLVERDRTGGDCLWTGCVPSKALLAAAHLAADARAAGRLGVHVGEVRVDFGEVMTHVRAAITAIEPDDSPGTLRAAGVQVVRAEARFSSAGTAVLLGGDAPATVGFRSAVLATGSRPGLPAVPGLTAAAPLTSDNVWALTELPARLLVIGGGSIGCELGQAFARLGARVSLVEAGESLLAREDPAAAALVHGALARDGVDVRLGVSPTAVRRTGDGWTAQLDDGRTVDFDRVLVAVGRTPRTADLGLELAGVGLDDRGYVRVDAHLRTTNPRVWAAGDLTGYPPFTHVAGVHGSLAAANAVLGLTRSVDPTAIPRVTFTQPEVAAVGVSSDQPAGAGYTVRTVAHHEVDRAVAEDVTDGLTRLVLDGRGRIVGATIVGPRAGESLAELVLTVQQRLTVRDLAGAVHAYPTYGDGVWTAGVGAVRDQLSGRLPRLVVWALLARRRRRANRNPASVSTASVASAVRNGHDPG